ncbi:zinc finger protein 704 isoform X1 [Anarhichas minor]|uniref:zinc finger protein 704 isoform X1 n=1 Tax=Anarhichas minor TaxID=65739 RepID=UPI003F740028
MDSTYIVEQQQQQQPSRVVGAAEFSCRTGRSVLRDIRVPAVQSNGPVHMYTNGPVFYKCRMDDGGSAAEFRGERTSLRGNGLAPGGRIVFHDVEKTGLGDHRDAGSSGILKRTSPTHCPGVNGRAPGGFMHLDIRNPGKQTELAHNFRAPQGRIVPPTDRTIPSSHIPVPRNRKPSGHADKEVMAATVLTSLSTSPLVLHPSSAPTVPEPASRAWKEVLSASYSSSTSGNWSWDASDQSVPSTPSPPLSNNANKNFLLSSQGYDVVEDVAENTHFMFEDPIPRKRKNSMKVMFKCLWKNCEKVLSTSLGIQRHIRSAHLGRGSDSDYSDGEEDFYYTEIEVNMDSLTEGLSSLTPTSPTTSAPPPAFPSPLAAVSHSEHINVSVPQSPAPTMLSQSAPSVFYHIQTDHAYQATAPVSIPVGPELAGLGTGTGPGTGNDLSASWTPPRVISKGVPGAVNTRGLGEKRQPADAANALLTPPTKTTPGTRKPRGEAKKCRKVYGMEKKEMWCTACRWKKACQRFTDYPSSPTHPESKK